MDGAIDVAAVVVVVGCLPAEESVRFGRGAKDGARERESESESAEKE
jgi:hypothetical protein